MALVRANDVERTIDLRGPDGNAFALMGQMVQWGKQLGWDKTRINAVRTEMMSGDYTNLVNVMEREFGSFCNFILPEGFNNDDN